MQLFGNKKHLDTREADWIEGAKRGERRSQKAIYDILSAKMMAVCMRYMGDKDSAEDVLQDGFEEKVAEAVPEGRTIALYCRSGNRSKKAANALASKYKVIELGTGYIGWTKEFGTR